MRHIIIVVAILLMSIQLLFGAENSRIVSPADVYSIEIVFSPNDNFKGSMYEQIVSISQNNLLLCSIIYEYSQENETYISFISEKETRRIREYSDRIITVNDTIRYNISIDKVKKNCIIIGSSDTIVFDNIDNLNILGSRLTITPFPSADCIDLVTFEILETVIDNKNRNEFIWIVAIILFDIIVFAYIHRQNKKRDKAEKDAKEQNITVRHREFIKEEGEKVSEISLFGDFRAYSKDGINISSKFSPILKELFFLLICHSNGKGVSSESLKSILWYDKSEQSANNNRCVYFNKLRNLINNIGDCKIVGESGYWKIEISGIDIDYLQFLQIMSKGIVSKGDVRRLLFIVEKGQFINNFDAEWLDSIKSDISDSVITILSSYITGLNVKDETNLIIQICDALFVFDPLSEIGLEYKCKAFKEIGKHTLAKQLYSNYTKEYLTLYGEEYSKSFSEIMVD